MPNLAAVLKQEIRRLARKEAKALTAPLRSMVARQRKSVAALKALVAAQGNEIGRLKALMKAPGAPPGPRVPDEVVRNTRWRKDTVRAIRNSLGLSQAEFAELVGVSVNAVYQWEAARSLPREKYRAVMLGLRRLGKRDARRLLEA